MGIYPKKIVGKKRSTPGVQISEEITTKRMTSMLLLLLLLLLLLGILNPCRQVAGKKSKI